MKRRIVILVSFLLAISMILPLGVTFAAKPVELSAILYCEGEILDSRVAGNNVFSYRELEGTFTSGIVGTVDRRTNTHLNRLLNSPNGPVIPSFVGTVQQVLYVTDAEVTVGDDLVIGSFVIKASGKMGNVNWRITSSDVTVDDEPVKLHGNGKLILNYNIPTGPTTFITEVTLEGQISFS